ncbi:hypothetical protein [Clostridium sp. 'White wine YQ']|uniref:hypothetical protein n=1 Tax=Clostridium sp. 'White wine YQ' TaxID=3027474 RepID=UPI002365F068|nr:hypothetical protein [Clostridium sp. 'White wine YQ']MDD7794408.1 hypothetical protein [Clostridium sp. 'White wine YQ']
MADEQKPLRLAVTPETPRVAKAARVKETVKYRISVTNMSSARVKDVSLKSTFDRGVVLDEENSTPGWEAPQANLLGSSLEVIEAMYSLGDLEPWATAAVTLAASAEATGRLEARVAARGEVEVPESPVPIEVTGEAIPVAIDIVEASTSDAVMRVYDENPGTISVNYRLWKKKILKEKRTL